MNSKRDLILLVEDDPNDEILALRAFHKSKVDADILVIRDGAEVLEFLFGTGNHLGRDLSVQPTCVMLDLHLPKMSGLEVLRRLKQDERTRSIPVTMLTGSDYDVIKAETLRQGAEACYMKPVTSEGFQQIAGQQKAAHP